MITIYKYEVTAYPTTCLIHDDAQFLSVQAQHNKPQIWFLVDTDKNKKLREFICYGTGHEITQPKDGKSLEFLGTFQLYDGSFVGHLFEIV